MSPNVTTFPAEAFPWTSAHRFHRGGLGPTAPPDALGTIAQARTLAAELYTSPAIFEQEQERIFSKLWFCVGREEDVGEPGDFLTRDIGEESLLVVRGDDGIVRAFVARAWHHRAST